MSGWDASSPRHQQRRLSGHGEQKRARRVLRQHSYICHVCNQPAADQVDHVIPVAEGGADTEDNLRPIHAEPCHRDKTLAEATRARRRLSRRARPPERHPGLIDPPEAT